MILWFQKGDKVIKEYGPPVIQVVEEAKRGRRGDEVLRFGNAWYYASFFRMADDA